MFMRLLFLIPLVLPLLVQAADVNSTYYTVRLDPRMCPSPACGGLFVHRVNRPSTRCADGNLQSECYAASMNLSGLNLTLDDEAAAQTAIGNGTVLLKGRLINKAFDAIGTFGEFVVTEVWEAATDASPAGVFYRAVDHGIVCVTGPCLSYREFKLNDRWQQRIAGIDLSPVGASDQQLAQANAALHTADGILLAGIHQPVKGPAGRAPVLVASQFYLAAKPGQPKKCYVGGCSGQVCSDSPGVITTCLYQPEYACYKTAHCERQTDNTCGWTPTPGLTQCLNKARGAAGAILQPSPAIVPVN